MKGETPQSDRPEVLRKTRHLDPARIIRTIALDLDAMRSGFALLDATRARQPLGTR